MRLVIAVVPAVAGIDAGSLPKRFIFVLVCLMYEAQVVQVFVSCFVGMTELAETKAESFSSRFRASVFKGRPRMMRRLCELAYPVVLTKAIRSAKEWIANQVLSWGVAFPYRIDEVNWKLAIAEGDRAAHQIFSLLVAFNRILRRVAIFGLSA